MLERAERGGRAPRCQPPIDRARLQATVEDRPQSPPIGSLRHVLLPRSTRRYGPRSIEIQAVRRSSFRRCRTTLCSAMRTNSAHEAATFRTECAGSRPHQSQRRVHQSERLRTPTISVQDQSRPLARIALGIWVSASDGCRAAVSVKRKLVLSTTAQSYRGHDAPLEKSAKPRASHDLPTLLVQVTALPAHYPCWDD